MTSFAFILGVVPLVIRDRRRRQCPQVDRHRRIQRHARLDLPRRPVRAVVLRRGAAVRGVAGVTRGGQEDEGGCRLDLAGLTTCGAERRGQVSDEIMQEIAQSADDKPSTTRQSVRKSHHQTERPQFECIALVLQGGGALGAFQGGVYQALAEAESASRLGRRYLDRRDQRGLDRRQSARNARRQAAGLLGARDDVARDQLCRLAEAFWTRRHGAQLHQSAQRDASALLRGVPDFFAPRPIPPCAASAGNERGDELLRHHAVARRRWNGLSISIASIPGDMRFSVGAVNVRKGNFVYFDTTSHTIRPEHIMASGALPPGFPGRSRSKASSTGTAASSPTRRCNGWSTSEAAAGHAGVSGRSLERARRGAQRSAGGR